MAGFPYKYPFSWMIALCGLISLSFIVGNLWILGLQRYPAEARKHVVEGDVARGRQALRIYGCGGCHVIPGIPNASGRVGPKLEEISQQIYLGGVLTNTPENLALWIRKPHEFSPETVMPNLGVSEQDAKDMAAYLYEL